MKNASISPAWQVSSLLFVVLVVTLNATNVHYAVPGSGLPESFQGVIGVPGMGLPERLPTYQTAQVAQVAVDRRAGDNGGDSRKEKEDIDKYNKDTDKYIKSQELLTSTSDIEDERTVTATDYHLRDKPTVKICTPAEAKSKTK